HGEDLQPGDFVQAVLDQRHHFRFAALALIPGFEDEAAQTTVHAIHAVDVEVRLRSEEHTSELQSRENLVCRLLLEKKKIIHILPNVFSVLIVNLASDIRSLILVKSSLSFLDIDVSPPTPSWGYKLTNAQTFLSKGT